MSRRDPKTEDRTSRVGRAEADPQRTDVGFPKPSCLLSDFNRTDSALRPSRVEWTGNGPPKNTWSFHLRHYRLWIFSLNRFSLKRRSPERSDIQRRYAWRRCGGPDFSTKQQHPYCRCKQLEPSRSRLIETCAPVDRAIKLLLLHQTQLHIPLRSLRWLCTPEVSTSMRFLHCRI